MTYLLYNAPQSTCSQRVRFTFHSKGISFDEKKLSLLDGDQLKPDYMKLNPNAVVPTLDHDGKIVIDSAVIMEYLDEVEPAKSFTPRDPVKRAEMRSQIQFIDEMPAASVRIPTFNIAFLPRFQKMTPAEFVAFAESKPLRKEMMLAMGQNGFPEAEMNASLSRMQRTYERMDMWIEQSGGPWLLGKDIALSDIALMPALVRMDDLNLGHMWAKMPRVSKWYDNIRAHPAFAPTFYHGTLLTQIFPHLAELAKKRA